MPNGNKKNFIHFAEEIKSQNHIFLEEGIWSRSPSHRVLQVIITWARTQRRFAFVAAKVQCKLSDVGDVSMPDTSFHLVVCLKLRSSLKPEDEASSYGESQWKSDLMKNDRAALGRRQRNNKLIKIIFHYDRRRLSGKSFFCWKPISCQVGNLAGIQLLRCSPGTRGEYLLRGDDWVEFYFESFMFVKF